MQDRIELLAEALLADIWPVRMNCLQYFDDRRLAAMIESSETEYPTIAPGRYTPMSTRKSARPGQASKPRQAAAPQPKAAPKAAAKPLDRDEPQRVVMWLINKAWKPGDPEIESLVSMATWQPVNPKPKDRAYREFQSLGVFTSIQSAEQFADFVDPMMQKLLADGKITGGRIMTCNVGDEEKTLAMDDAQYAAHIAERNAENEPPDDEDDDDEDEDDDDDD